LFVTNHVLAGVAVGAACPDRPLLAFAAGFATHLPMDCCRHWGFPGGDIHNTRFLRAAIGDGCVGLGVLAAAHFAARRRGRSTTVPVLAGALGAAILDVDKPARLLLGWNPVPLALQRVHQRVQQGVEAPEHLWREGAWAGALAVVAMVSLRSSGKRRELSPSARR
jgi:hypothetical protein